MKDNVKEAVREARHDARCLQRPVGVVPATHLDWAGMQQYLCMPYPYYCDQALCVATPRGDVVRETLPEGYDTYVPGRLPGDHGRVVRTTAE